MKKIGRKEKRRGKEKGKFRKDSLCGFKRRSSALLGSLFWPPPFIKQP